jgi:hypothetical protein
MRVSLTASAVVASMVLSLVGCSSMSMSPIWQKLSFRSKKSAASSAVASAPAAPSFNSATAAVPTVSMPAAVQTSGNLPVYPGTTYPVTPYPATAAPSAMAANQPAYQANPPAGDAGMAPQGAASGSNAQAVAGYAPGSTQAAPYAPPQYPPYTPPAQPAGPYNAASPSDTYTR